MLHLMRYRSSGGYSASNLALSCIVLALLVCRSTQETSGYNVVLSATPESMYSLPDRISVMNCRAQNVSSGTTENLDVRFIRNSVPLTDKHNLPARHFYATDDGFTITGLLIYPTTLEDNGAIFQCQVVINGQAVNITSPKATMIVADGRPPAISSLSVVSTSFQTITVRWNPILVPSDGPILSYMAYLYDTSSNLLSATPFGNKQQNSYTFTGLQTDSSYQVEIVAVNQYGDGNHSVPVKAVTQRSLQAPSPTSLTFETLGNGQLSVNWNEPTVDYHTMLPISYYNLTYYASGATNISTVRTQNNSTLQIDIDLHGLIRDQEYIFILTPINNGAGPLNFINKTFTISYPTSFLPTFTTQVVSSSLLVTSTQKLTTTTTSSIPSPTSSSLVHSPTSTSVTSSPSIETSSPSIEASSASIKTSSPSIVTSSTATSLIDATLVTTTTTTTLSTTRITTTSLQHTTTSYSTLSTTQSPITENYSSMIVFATAAVASVIIIAIVILAIILVSFCIYTTRKKDNVDLTDGPTTWPDSKRASEVKKWNSKEGSLKESSSLSGSITSEHEIPSFDNIDNHIYANIPSDSPSSRKSEHDLGSIDELSEEVVVVVEPPVTTL